MTEMKNICGKIPKDLHEKVREEKAAHRNLYSRSSKNILKDLQEKEK